MPWQALRWAPPCSASAVGQLPLAEYGPRALAVSLLGLLILRSRRQGRRPAPPPLYGLVVMGFQVAGFNAMRMA